MTTVNTGGTETILLVEDDPAVRQLVHFLLTDLGYRVIVAGDAEHALDSARRVSGPIDLVVTDVGLPGMKGPELFGQLHLFYPKAKVLYISGSLSPANIQAERLDILPKPFTPAALAQRIRRILDA